MIFRILLIFCYFFCHYCLSNFLHGKDYALFFAVNAYENLKDLGNPISNAKDIAQILETDFGFTVEIVSNPSLIEVEKKLIEYKNKFQEGIFDPNGQLFIYFSGHGMQELDEGYFLPQDADPGLLRRTAIAYTYWRKFINSIDCNHILVAIDACHSATFDPDWKNRTPIIFQRVGELSVGDKLILQHKLTKTRLFFTSDGEGDETPDKSNFAKKLQEGLLLPADKDGILTSTDIWARLTRAFPSPRAGEFGDDKANSSFLFIRNDESTSEKFKDYNFKKIDPFKPIQPGQSPNNVPLFPKMIQIRGGKFNMGNEDSKTTSPVRKITVPNFYLSQTEVTNQQFCEFLNEIGNKIEAGIRWLDIKSDNCLIIKKKNLFVPKATFENHPVIEVSWYGAIAYCRWLKTNTGQTYRLPSEVEWEYAAGGGGQNRTRFSGTENIEELELFAVKNQIDKVGSKNPNQLGIYDMTGNVLEWCQDKGKSNYKNIPSTAKSWEKGMPTSRIVRGGTVSSNNYRDIFCRELFIPARTHKLIGFRVAHGD